MWNCLINYPQGAVYHKLGNLVMAEKVLREAINIDPTAFEAWWVIAFIQVFGLGAVVNH